MSGRRVALVVCGLALVLAGCGDSGDEPQASRTVTVTAEPTSGSSETPSSTPSSTPSFSVAPTATVPSATQEPSVAPTKSATAQPSPRPSGPPDDGVPRTYDAALEHFDTWGSEPVRARRFQSPSGNIYCVVKHDIYPSACEIGEGAVRDAAVCAGSPTSRVGRIEFHQRRAVPVCNTDTFWEPGAPVLGYGEAARVPGGDVMCLSETIGVTCISLSRTEGFFLHRGEYVIFNAG